MLQNFYGGFGNARMEVVVEGVRPEHDLWLPFIAYTASAEPFFKCLVGKPGHAALLGYTTQRLHDVRKSGRLGEEVHQSWRKRSQPRPPVDQAHSVGRTR